MNKITLMGRLTADPEMRVTQGEHSISVAKFSLAVDRKKVVKGGDKVTDFFICVSFGKQAEFVDKYLKKGVKILLTGRVENNNYTNNKGEKVYSVQVIIEEIEFAESKKAEQPTENDDFVSIPDGIEDELPFN